MAHWLIVEPKQSTFSLSMDISLLILEEEEVHAIGVLEGEATLAWQTCALILFCKISFFFKHAFNSFEMEIILFFKSTFSFKAKSILEDKFSFFFN